MKIVPAELGSEPVTTSERRVFDALATGTTRGTGLHSLNLPEHEYKLTSELDFVLVLDELVLVVEVKGGQVSCRDGLWTYSDRSGHFRQSREGPFKQAQSGMYALRDRLRRHLGSVVDDIAFGFLVVTPDIDLALSSFEWDEPTYCGRGPFNRDFDRVIGHASDYWVPRQPDKIAISKELHGRLMQELRPSFDRSPLLDARASALDVAFVRLTDEQYERIDIISDEPRVICNGGAGTGKTFLAMEIARRGRLLDRSVLYTCRSEVLAAFVRYQLAGTGVVVRAASQLAADASTYDVALIDEAQDLMTFENLERLEPKIVGGLAEGKWVMFMDQNRQAHLYGDFDDDALQYVRSLHPVTAALRTNCRNTREIAFQTRALTGADTGVAAAGSGPEVQIITVADANHEAVQLEAHLRTLREHEIPVGNVTIVSLRGDWETSAARGLREARRGHLKRLDAACAEVWPGDQLTWASVVDIKGLENRFVCVIDIDMLESELDIDLLYVALSRPRAGLWLAARPAIASRIAELYQANVATAISALKAAGA